MNRKRFALKLFALILLNLLLFTHISLAGLDAEPTTLERIASIMNQAEEDLDFSGSVMIVQNGEVLLHEGYGFANKEWLIENTTESKFLIGDITKQFTAMAILILQERDQLDIHDPICMYLDPCTEIWDRITIEQIMNHTSGISEWFNHPDFDGYSDLVSTRRNKLLEMLMEVPLQFEPGASSIYSDSAYTVLGDIIRSVSGFSYERFLKENILVPLGMENTGIDSPDRIIGNRVEGYAGPTASSHADNANSSLWLASLDMYSTAEDLYLWQDALANRQVISEESWNAMLDAAYPVPDLGFDYLYGIIRSEIAGYTVFGHLSMVPGFTSNILFVPDANTYVVVLSNYQNTNAIFLADLAVKILVS